MSYDLNKFPKILDRDFNQTHLRTIHSEASDLLDLAPNTTLFIAPGDSCAWHILAARQIARVRRHKADFVALGFSATYNLAGVRDVHSHVIRDSELSDGRQTIYTKSDHELSTMGVKNYRDYLRQHGITPKKLLAHKQIIIVDKVCNGNGVMSFVDFLLDWADEYDIKDQVVKRLKLATTENTGKLFTLQNHGVTLENVLFEGASYRGAEMGQTGCLTRCVPRLAVNACAISVEDGIANMNPQRDFSDATIARRMRPANLYWSIMTREKIKFDTAREKRDRARRSLGLK